MSHLYYRVSPTESGFKPKEEGWFKKGAPDKRKTVESSGGTEQEDWDQMKVEVILEHLRKTPTRESAEQMLAAFQRDFKDAYAAAKADPKDKEAAARLDSLIAFYNTYLSGTETKVNPPKFTSRKVPRFEATA